MRFQYGPHSCSEESDDDPGKSAMFRLNNGEKSILAAFFLVVMGFLAFNSYERRTKANKIRSKIRRTAGCAAAALFVSTCSR